MRMTDKTYDTLKYIAQYVLPALGTLYFALSAIWGLPYGEQVVGTITAVDAFMGVLLGISTASYKKLDHSDGVMIVDTTNPEKDVYRMELNAEPEVLATKSAVTFKIDTTSAAAPAKKKTTAKKTKKTTAE